VTLFALRQRTLQLPPSLYIDPKVVASAVSADSPSNYSSMCKFQNVIPTSPPSTSALSIVLSPLGLITY